MLFTCLRSWMAVFNVCCLLTGLSDVTCRSRSCTLSKKSLAVCDPRSEWREQGINQRVCARSKWWSSLKSHVAYNFEDFFDIATIRSTRANHQYKLYIKPARLNCYKNSFFIRIVKLWNELPGDIVEADSFQHFKSKLKSYLNIWL